MSRLITYNHERANAKILEGILKKQKERKNVLKKEKKNERDQPMIN